MGEAQNDWVALSPRFTPGWPWPEDSWGLGPMFGDDGWCRGCGTPLVEQSGPLVMQGSKFPSAEVWMPNWRFDVVCVSAAVAEDIRARFDVDLGEVHKPRGGATGVMQVLPTLTTDPWYRADDLSRATRARFSAHEGDRTGSSCDKCGRWRWLPISEHDTPINVAALEVGADVVSSPEVFGDGMQSFRHLLSRRPLAEALVAASPRNWDLVEIQTV